MGLDPGVAEKREGLLEVHPRTDQVAAQHLKSTQLSVVAGESPRQAGSFQQWERFLENKRRLLEPSHEDAHAADLD